MKSRCRRGTSPDALEFSASKRQQYRPTAPRKHLSMRELFPPHDFGTWPKGFTASREQIYGDHGR